MPISPLDVTYEERHKLDPDRPHNREALVWVLPLPELELGLVAYTWVDAFGKAGAAGIAFGPRLSAPVFERVDDVAVDDDMGFADWRAGPMGFTLREPLVSSDVRYAGERLRMDFDFEALHPPYAYSSHAEPFPVFYADDRIEQCGRTKGSVSIDGVEHDFEGFCHRDHSWGARMWSGTQHYKWLNFISDEASVHVMDLQGFGRSTVRGYVQRDGDTSQIVASRFDYDLDDAFYHRRLEASFEDEAGRTTEVELLSDDAHLEYPIDPNVKLYDIVGRASVAGHAGVSYAEMAWPPDYVQTNLSEQKA